jgi:hypothetical protein
MPEIDLVFSLIAFAIGFVIGMYFSVLNLPKGK